jgi:hypothetical protein
MTTQWTPVRDAKPARPRRRPTTMDHVRTREFLARIERGEDETAAFWAVASDPAIGFSRLRGLTERPPEIVLRKKLAALLERTVPEVVRGARDVALAKLSHLGDDAVRAVQETLVGDFEDGRAARVRLDAAKAVLQSLGIGERAAPLVATQINVGGQHASGGVPDGA